VSDAHQSPANRESAPPAAQFPRLSAAARLRDTVHIDVQLGPSSNSSWIFHNCNLQFRVSQLLRRFRFPRGPLLTSADASAIMQLTSPEPRLARRIMSEAMEKVRGLRELPIFPLPVVLFPGMPMPLHIFEERYRKMLSDIRAGNNLFGLSYFDPAASERDMPPAGHVGCVAEVAETQALPDGRSNILAVGLVRYEVESYVERGDLYLVGRARYFEDEDDDN